MTNLTDQQQACSVVITEAKPWRCLNCKRPAADTETTCGGCGDRLKAAPKRLG